MTKLVSMRHFLYTLSLLLLISFSGFAQNKSAVKSFQKAVNAFAVNKPDEGWRFLERAIEKSDEDYYQPIIYAGDRASKEGDLKKALKYYNLAIARQPLSSLYLKKARIHKYFFEWDEAIANYEIFLEQARLSKERRKVAQQELSNLKFAEEKYVEFQLEGSQVAIEKLVFSDDKMEYFPCITGDGESLMFTARDLDAMATDENMWVGERTGNGWSSKAAPMKGYINSRGNEGAATISADGTLMIFTACDRPDGKGSCDLYQSTYVPGRGWDKPQPLLGKVNTRDWESQPSLGPDGRTLFFVRGKHSQSTNLDIYTASLTEEGEWTNVAPLPSPVNTDKRESSPFIHFDGKTLYFTSERTPSIGGSDFFMTRRSGDTAWTTPENLGFPLNGFSDEFSFIVDHTGMKGYFASNRSKWNAPNSSFTDGLDLYSFELPQRIRPEVTAFVNGVVLNSTNQQKLSGAKISVYDLEDGRVLFEGFSAAHSGLFRPMLTPGKVYGFTGEKSGFLPFSERIELTDDATRIVEIAMRPLKSGSSFVLKNIYFELDKSELLVQSTRELEALYEVLRTNQELKATIIGHTDNQGSAGYNDKLSTQRAASVVSYLEELGIDASRLKAEGKGMREPIATNETEEGRAKNRRTEVLLR
jgi:outer membrane protein OmpA-like peptidoglycan-associated protein